MSKHVVIIGGGFYGCAIADKLQHDFDVTIVEKNAQLLQGVAASNVYRIHNGPHYPRSSETARQCIEGYRRFVPEFENCINTSFPNIYAIASEGSCTSLDDFHAFCKRLNIDHTPLAGRELPIHIYNCDGGVVCPEGTINIYRLREEYERRLFDCEILCNQTVTEIEQQGKQFVVSTNKHDFLADVVINCSFTDMNFGCKSLGFAPMSLQYQKTVCFKTKVPGANYGLTIVDGKFPTMFPSYWDEHSTELDAFILYHVRHSVLWEEKSETYPTYPQFPEHILERCFHATLEEVRNFVPSLPERIREVEYLVSDRVIRPRVKNTDTRVSEILNPSENYYVVFNGKIDYSLCIAEQMRDLL